MVPQFSAFQKLLVGVAALFVLGCLGVAANVFTDALAPRADASYGGDVLPAASSKPGHPPTSSPPIEGAPLRAVHPGARCTAHGKIGYTAAGARMRCSRTAGDPKYRWRAP